MRKDDKKRLFEVMGIINPSFKKNRLNEGDLESGVNNDPTVKEMMSLLKSKGFNLPNDIMTIGDYDGDEYLALGAMYWFAKNYNNKEIGNLNLYNEYKNSPYVPDVSSVDEEYGKTVTMYEVLKNYFNTTTPDNGLF